MVDSVLNRPLFRGRSGMEMEARRVVPSGIVSAIPRPAPGTQVIETENYGSFLFNPSTRQLTDRQGNRVPSEIADVILRDAAAAANRAGVAATAAGETALQDVQQGFEALPTVRPRMAGEVVQDLRGDLAAANTLSRSGQEQMDIFEELSRAAEKPIPEPVISRGPAGARPEGAAYGLPAARNAPQATSAPGAANLVRPTPVLPTGLPGAPGAEGEKTTAAPSPGTADQGPAFERSGRGPGPLVTSPSEVAAGLNAADPAVRERTVQDYMKEFTENAPKYEGGDKRLMHAMIGFAIAAGESPNAMTNIAKGLQAGAEMFIKDKAARDEFDRQIQLSAMQYGLGEVAKERALDRQFTNYVASKDVTYRGRKYGANESVPVLHSDILNGRMPEGVMTEGTSDALLATDAAVRKALVEAQKDQKLTPAAYNEALTKIDTAASDYSSAANLMPLLEASLIRTAQGDVTGIQPALKTKLNQVMNAFDLKPPEEYESREAYDSAMRQASVSLVQDLLGESGKTISDADRRLIDGLIGLYSSDFATITKDPDILVRKIQELMRVVEGKQRNALDTYNTLMEGYSGTYSPSGTPFRSTRAERVFSPEAMAAPIEYVWDQATNRLVLKRDGGQ